VASCADDRFGSEIVLKLIKQSKDYIIT